MLNTALWARQWILQICQFTVGLWKMSATHYWRGFLDKLELDALVAKYETEDFIKDDPVQFPHRFRSKQDVEIAGFVASLIATGSRKVFIRKLDELFAIAQNEPHNFVLNFEPGVLGGFNYRFYKTEDFARMFGALRGVYRGGGSLEELFAAGKVPDLPMLPDPAKGSAMKRVNMFLRWMVRKGPVDLGVWDCMKPSELLIPLDVHVARVSREMGLLKRNANDMKAVIELTDALREFDPDDPVKYDFAIFGKGVNNG
jgi:hypothetical protein